MELPVDVMLDILSRLPIETVLVSKLVCKYWRDVVRHPSFSKKHFNRLISSYEDSGNLGILLKDEGRLPERFHYFEYNENNETPITSPRKINLLPPELKFYAVTVVGSCNGLICVIQACSFIICNPITKEFVVLPEMKLCSLYGFGYLDSTDEYKVVRICESQESNSREVEVYTIGSGNGWRNVGKFNSEYGSHKIGVHANGALYWMIREKRMSIAFDLADEKFRETSLPEIPRCPYWNENFKLVGSWDDSLMCVDYRNRSDRSLDIWLLKENGVHGMNWEVVHKTMRLRWNERYFDVGGMEPIAFTNSGAVLCFKANNTNCAIYRYDFKLSSMEMLVSFDKPVFWPPFAHMKTLVSLKALGEENTKIME